MKKMSERLKASRDDRIGVPLRQSANEKSRELVTKAGGKLWLILGPSSIHGLGVFTTSDIKKGRKLPELFDDDEVIIKRRKPDNIVSRYSVKDKDGWWGPKNLHRMSIGWYLNHSSTPNLLFVCEEDGYEVFRALCSIRGGEELTVDYRTLSKYEAV
jgi:SET domain-containing protein